MGKVKAQLMQMEEDASHMSAEGWGAFTHPVTPLPQEASMAIRNDPPHSR